MTTMTEPVLCTREHAKFPAFAKHLVDERRFDARDLCKVLEYPHGWSDEFCAFLCGTNVRPPHHHETLREWLRDVVWARRVTHVCESCEGPARTWNEVVFCPHDAKGDAENLVADLTDWFGEPLNKGDRISFVAGTDTMDVEAVAIAHPEVRYGRQIVVFEIEAEVIYIGGKQ